MTECPICKCKCKDEDARHRHMEEKHSMPNVDKTLMEKVDGKVVLNG